MDNTTIAGHLRSHAAHLEDHVSTLYRVRAYRRAADQIERHPRPLEEVYAAEGRRGLQSLPGVGASLAVTLEELLTRGSIPDWKEREAAEEPWQALTRLSGVGPVLARHLAERLGVSTIEGLRQAAARGRLGDLSLGAGQLRALRKALDETRGQPGFPEMSQAEPDVADLLAIDAEYRSTLGSSWESRSAAELVWQPPFRRERGGWRFRAQPCKAALAYRMGKADDWVVIHFSNGITEGKRVVVTETRGELRGRRVVRGREDSCRAQLRDRELAGSAS